MLRTIFLYHHLLYQCHFFFIDYIGVAEKNNNALSYLLVNPLGTSSELSSDSDPYLVAADPETISLALVSASRDT